LIKNEEEIVVKVQVFEQTKEMGQAAATHAARVLNEVIARGEASTAAVHGCVSVCVL